MIVKTFYHQLETGENAKFTIREKIVNGQRYFFANVVSTDLDFYKELSELEKEACLGVEVSNGKQNTVFYSNPEKLELDIRTYYGKKWLESEI